MSAPQWLRWLPHDIDGFLVWLASRSPAVLVIVGGLWGGWQFYFREFAKPNWQAPFVIMQAHIDTGVPTDGLIPVRCDITVENATDRLADIFSAYYEVSGTVMQKVRMLDPEYAAVVGEAASGATRADRSVMNAEQKVMSAGLLTELGSPLQPKERRTMQFVTYVPTDSFGVLRLHAWVITQSRKSGFAPLLELHGGGWLGMSAADTSEKDKIGLTKWRVVPEQDRRLVRAGFVTSQVHAECSVPGASFRPVETTH